MSSIGRVIPSTIWPIWKEEMEALAAKAAQERPGLTVKRFLAENLAGMVRLLGEIAEEYQSYILSEMDTHRCTATYGLAGTPAEIETILRSKPEFELAEFKAENGIETPLGLFLWLPIGESAELGKELPKALLPDPQSGKVGPFASVCLYGERMIVETLSPLKYDFVKKMMEQYLGDRVGFQSETIVDLAKQARERKAAAETLQAVTAHWESSDQSGGRAAAVESAEGQGGSGTPTARLPAGTEEKLMQEAHEQYYAALLDKAHVRLDGWTPRAAAKDAAMRPRLLELMKDDIHNLDRQNLETGLHLHLDRVLDELGLPELK